MQIYEKILLPCITKYIKIKKVPPDVVRSALEAVEEYAGIDAWAACEVSLAVCGIQKPVGLDDKAEFRGKGDLNAEERCDGHECILVHGTLLLGDVITCAALDYNVVFDSSATDEAT